ncbi:MAG: ketoacyl-ACP synthase [Moraxellaceae bacterium]|jgi:3-oxoacyl-[acyl-carrier-protein] synthase-3|nr:ketoacyl-ACP synthase [Moraxellaceae bacterium]
MAIFTLDNVRISAIAAAVPAAREKNSEYSAVSEQERALLIKTTGVEERRIAASGLTASDLCAAAADELITKCAVDRKEIGLLVFVSQSGDYYLPATAALLQHRLGLSTRTIAFDVGLGCSGYVYGLAITASLMRTFGLQKALLLAGDVSSITLSPDDKSTYPLFGDAGSATLLEAGHTGAPWHFNLSTDGSGANAIIIPDGGTRNKVSESSFLVEPVAEGIKRNRLNLVLDGPEIFSFAVREVPASIRELAGQTGQNPEDFDYFVMHQANRLINETIRKKLAMPAEKVPYSIDQFGNTSSASIPLTMAVRLRSELESSSLKLLLSGFGVGLSWGTAFLHTNEVICLPLLEIAVNDGQLPRP